MSLSERVEPRRDKMELWASGRANIYSFEDRICYQEANWAWWYLGYDDPHYDVWDTVSNTVIIRFTHACILRLKELNNE